MRACSPQEIIKNNFNKTSLLFLTLEYSYKSYSSLKVESEFRRPNSGTKKSKDIYGNFIFYFILTKKEKFMKKSITLCSRNMFVFFLLSYDVVVETGLREDVDITVLCFSITWPASLSSFVHFIFLQLDINQAQP